MPEPGSLRLLIAAVSSLLLIEIFARLRKQRVMAQLPFFVSRSLEQVNQFFRKGRTVACANRTTVDSGISRRINEKQ